MLFGKWDLSIFIPDQETSRDEGSSHVGSANT